MSNKYHVADNLDILKNIESNSCSLIYLDPPFATGRHFGDFDDKFESIKDYAYEFIKPRLVELKRIMTADGNIIVHVESKVSHYIRLIMDEVFGEKKFKTEIIWCSGGNKKCKTKLMRFHDVLIHYTKTSKPIFNPEYTNYSEEYIKKLKWCDKHEDYYSTSAAHSSQPDVVVRMNLRYKWNEHHKQWLFSQETMQRLHDENRLKYNSKGIPRVKRFLKELSGVPINDVWSDIASIQSKEKMDYATQKPIKLLERIIKMFSNENDIVLDCFAGSGTTGRAAILHSRQYILIDKNSKGKNLFEQSIKELSNQTLKDFF